MRKLQSFLAHYGYLVVILIALPLFGRHLTYGDLWNDETFTKELVGFPLGKLMALLADDYHPPLYFLVLKGFVALFGASALALRAFSVVAVLATLVLIGTTGSRVLGKPGALWLGLVALTLPMQATYAHTARMYTWASFATTGVFLYALVAMRDPRTRNLLLLGLYTLLGAYTHYYCVFAALCAHLFVFVHGLVTKTGAWKRHLAMVAGLVVAYLPWVVTLLYQVGRVRQDFHQPPLSGTWVLLCYLMPFFHNYYPTPASHPLLAAYALLTVAGTILILRRKDSPSRLPLLLSLVVFNGTVLIAVIVSLLLRTILYYRYMSTMVVLLAVPPALFFLELRHAWIRRVLLAAFLGLGLYAAQDAGKDTVGPYRASLAFLKAHHPAVTKVLHPTELTVGPSLEYNALGPWTHYWLANGDAVAYTNLAVYRGLRRVADVGDMVKDGERFGLIDFPGMPLNRKNLALVLAHAEVLATDTLFDDKVTVAKMGIPLTVYALRYRAAGVAGKAP